MVDGSVMEWIGRGVVPGGVVDGSVMEWIGGGSTWWGGRRVCHGVDRGGVVPGGVRVWLLGRAVVNRQINIVNM